MNEMIFQSESSRKSRVRKIVVCRKIVASIKSYKDGRKIPLDFRRLDAQFQLLARALVPLALLHLLLLLLLLDRVSISGETRNTLGPFHENPFVAATRIGTKVRGEWSSRSFLHRATLLAPLAPRFSLILFSSSRSWQSNALIAESNNVRDGEDVSRYVLHVHTHIYIHTHTHTLYIFIHKCIIYR